MKSEREGRFHKRAGSKFQTVGAMKLKERSPEDVRLRLGIFKSFEVMCHKDICRIDFDGLVINVLRLWYRKHKHKLAKTTTVLYNNDWFIDSRQLASRQPQRLYQGKPLVIRSQEKSDSVSIYIPQYV